MSQRVVDAAYASIGTGVLLMSIAMWYISNEISKKCEENKEHKKGLDWLYGISLVGGGGAFVWEFLGSSSVPVMVWGGISFLLTISTAVAASIGINSYNKCSTEKKKDICKKDKNYMIIMLTVAIAMFLILVYKLMTARK